MSQGFLDKLKKSVIAGAATSAAKVEEAAKIGKLHLDLMNEKRKLGTKNSELGVLVYQFALDKKLTSLSEDTEFTTIVGAISEVNTTILELEKNLARVKKEEQSDLAEDSESKEDEQTEN